MLASPLPSEIGGQSEQGRVACGLHFLSAASCSVELEDQGGDGTAGSHWKQRIYKNDVCIAFAIDRFDESYYGWEHAGVTIWVPHLCARFCKQSVGAFKAGCHLTCGLFRVRRWSAKTTR